MATKLDLLNAIKNNLQDRQDQLSTLDQNLDMAVTMYSTYRPKLCRSPVIGSGTLYAALPATWQADFSQLRHLEYVETQTTPPYIISAEVVATQESQCIRATELLRDGIEYLVVFTKSHDCTETACTIPPIDIAAVVDYATMQSYLQLAALHVPSIDQTFDQAPLRQQSSAAQYQKLAEVYFTKWQTAMGRESTSSVHGARIEWSVGRDSRKLWH